MLSKLYLLLNIVCSGIEKNVEALEYELSMTYLLASQLHLIGGF